MELYCAQEWLQNQSTFGVYPGCIPVEHQLFALMDVKIKLWPDETGRFQRFAPRRAPLGCRGGRGVVTSRNRCAFAALHGRAPRCAEDRPGDVSLGITSFLIITE